MLIQSGPQGYFFCQKWYIKGKGLNLGADPPCIKIYQVTAYQNSPPPLHPNPRWGSQIKSQERSNSPLANPILHLVCPAKFCISIVFDFSWGLLKYPGKKRNTKVNAKYFGANKVYYGRCANLELDILRLFIKLNSSHGFV